MSFSLLLNELVEVTGFKSALSINSSAVP